MLMRKIAPMKKEHVVIIRGGVGVEATAEAGTTTIEIEAIVEVEVEEEGAEVGV
jgi:hypothetical protein